MKFIKFVFVLGAIAVALYLTNPPLKAHEDTVDLTMKVDPASRAEWQAKYGMSISAVGRKRIYYQDYHLFSTTTDDDGGLLSFGILHKVFRLRSTRKEPPADAPKPQ